MSALVILVVGSLFGSTLDEFVLLITAIVFSVGSFIAFLFMFRPPSVPLATPIAPTPKRGIDPSMELLLSYRKEMDEMLGRVRKAMNSKHEVALRLLGMRIPRVLGISGFSILLFGALAWFITSRVSTQIIGSGVANYILFIALTTASLPLVLFLLYWKPRFVLGL